MLELMFLGVIIEQLKQKEHNNAQYKNISQTLEKSKGVCKSRNTSKHKFFVRLRGKCNASLACGNTT